MAGHAAVAPALQVGSAGAERLHAQPDMEAGHVLLQRKKFLLAHHHDTEQTSAPISRRQDPLLFKVIIQLNLDLINRHCFMLICVPRQH